MGADGSRAVARVWVVGALLVAMGLGSAASTASASSEESVRLIYAVDYSKTEWAPDGSVSGTETGEGELWFDCTPENCELLPSVTVPLWAPVGLTPPMMLAPPAWDAVAEFSPYTDDCATYRPPGTLSISISATAVEAREYLEPVITLNCPASPGGYNTPGWEVVIVSSSLLSGECVFARDGCVDATPAPTPIDPPADPDAETADADLLDASQQRTSQLSTGDPAAPSMLSGLPTVGQAPTAPAQLAANLLVTLILLILVAFPTALLNSASEQLSERMGAWRTRRRVGEATGQHDSGSAASSGAAPGRGLDWRGWPLAALTVLAAALISGFADAEFGLNPGSARMVASIAIGFALDVVLGWSIVVLLTRRLVPRRAAFEAKPMTLLIVVGAVILTRVTGFEPGVLFGVVAGVAFAGLTIASQRARPVLIALGYAFALAIVAWFAYSAVVGVGSADAGSIFATETLAAVAASGIAALPIALVPLRGLPGHAVWAWSRWLWAGCYAVGLFAFFFVLMPMPPSWGAVSWPLWGWIFAYLAYATFAVLAWWIVGRPRGTTDAAEPGADESGLASIHR